jgi:Ca2+-transporting ATPase
MIRQLDLPQNATKKAVAGDLNRPVATVGKWHARGASAIPELLGVDPSQGLMETEVIIRRRQYGANSSESQGSRRITAPFLLLFLSIFIGFLTTAAVLNSAIANSLEVISIVLVTVLGAIVAFSYLLKSARALDRMSHATQTNAHVKRGGQDIEINAEELVPGDILILKAGDYVPADCRLLESAQLRVNESALTGKDTGAAKQVSAVPLNADIGQRLSMLFLGTKIMSGSALAAVVGTGFQTELGKRAIGEG